MAFLAESRLLITDASNMPLNGGKARIYDANTQNLTSVFSDAGLSVPLANPIVANSAGITPQVFAAEGTIVDIQYLTSAGALVSGRDYSDVVFVGADTGNFTRTLSGGTRFKISDSGGVVLLEAGDASPDNSGGTAKIQGWAGTQGDLLTLNFTTVNIVGTITENGKKLRGVVYTEATTFTAQTSVAIPLTNIPTGVRGWQIDIIDWIQSVASQITIHFSYDGGATYKTGVSDYAYIYIFDDASTTQVRDNAHTGIIICDNSVATSGREGYLTIYVTAPSSGGAATIVRTQLDAFDESTTPNSPLIAKATGWCVGGYGRPTHIRLTPNNAATISGKYREIIERGLGET